MAIVCFVVSMGDRVPPGESTNDCLGLALSEKFH